MDEEEDEGGLYGICGGSGVDSGDGYGGFGGTLTLACQCAGYNGYNDGNARLDEQFGECGWECLDGNGMESVGWNLVELGCICAGGDDVNVVEFGVDLAVG